MPAERLRGARRVAAQDGDLALRMDVLDVDDAGRVAFDGRGQFVHRHVAAGPGVQHLAGGRVGQQRVAHEPCAVGGVQQVARLRAVAVDPEVLAQQGAAGEDRHDPALAHGALERTVGVERTDHGCRQAVRVPVRHREGLARQLRRRVGRRRLRRVVLVDAAQRRRAVVHHARAHEQKTGPRRARSLEQPERPDDVVLERLGRIVDGVLDRDRRGKVGDRLDLARPAAARLVVADIAALERQKPRVTVELREVRHVAGDKVVDRQHLVPARQELADDPSADEPGRARDQDPHAGPRSESKVSATILRTSSCVIG